MIWRISPTHTPEVRFTLEECQNILSRRVEIQRARRPGRHKDADVQILRFAELFAPVPDTCQVQSFHTGLNLSSTIGTLVTPMPTKNQSQNYCGKKMLLVMNPTQPQTAQN